MGIESVVACAKCHDHSLLPELEKVEAKPSVCVRAAVISVQMSGLFDLRT